MTLYLAPYTGDSHRLLHRILEMHTDCTDWRICRASGGKPYAVSCRYEKPLFFSLSHSGAFFSCLCHTQPVGVDIQTYAAPHHTRLAERWLHPEEYALYLAHDGAPEYFFRLWSAKEAYVKYTGQGIDGRFRALSVTALSEYVRILPCIPDYTLALCAAKPDPLTVVPLSVMLPDDMCLETVEGTVENAVTIFTKSDIAGQKYML